MISKNGGIHPPWKANFYQLISLWEIMDSLQPYPYQIMKLLESLKGFEDKYASSVGVISENDSRNIENCLKSIKRLSEKLVLNVSKIQAVKAQQIMRTNDANGFSESLARVREIIIDELQNIRFLHVESKYIDYYDEEPLFGIDVADKFPSMITDIQEAGKCFALYRFTSCVFHLMRVMEIAVQKIGKKLKVKLTKPIKDVTWHNIGKAIKKTVDDLPEDNDKKKDKKDKYQAVYVHLDSVRIAWRNKTMHPKETYNESEAYKIINAVEIFLQDLVTIL